MCQWGGINDSTVYVPDSALSDTELETIEIINSRIQDLMNWMNAHIAIALFKSWDLWEVLRSWIGNLWFVYGLGVSNSISEGAEAGTQTVDIHIHICTCTCTSLILIDTYPYYITHQSYTLTMYTPMTIHIDLSDIPSLITCAVHFFCVLNWFQKIMTNT